MSFILDALKKSENERQQNAPPEFATVPAAADTPRAPRWLWVLAALLAINVIALTALALRPQSDARTANVVERPPAAVEAQPSVAVDVAPPAEFADQLEQARQNHAEQTAAGATQAEPVAVVATADTDATRSTSRDPDTRRALLPTFTELTLDGSLQIPDLHIDIHVYSDNPSDRFVFINMNKYRENDQLGEGPVVAEIARDGVVLEHRGTRFMLPRE